MGEWEENENKLKITWECGQHKFDYLGHNNTKRLRIKSPTPKHENTRMAYNNLRVLEKFKGHTVMPRVSSEDAMLPQIENAIH